MSRTRSKKTEKKVAILLQELVSAIENGNWGKYWTINDMAHIVYEGETYITPDKKAQTRYALSVVKRLLREKFKIAFYSVPGKGYRLWPDVNELPEEMRNQTKNDALAVWRKWLDYARTLFSVQGPLIAMKERGDLKLEATDVLLVDNTKELLNHLVQPNYADNSDQQT